MHLISFDASPRQLSKIRNGHSVRIKRGSGFNLVVHPQNYHLVSRAFSKNKGLELKLSPEELETNMNLSPEEHEELGESMNNEMFEHLPFAEGGSIFSKIKKGVNKALHSKTAKHIGHELKPFGRELKKIGKDILHEKIAEAHMRGADKYGDDERTSRLMNIGAEIAHRNVAGSGVDFRHGGIVKPFPSGGKLSFKSIGKKINKALHSKTAKSIGRELKPFTRALKSTAKDFLHDKLAEMHMEGANNTDDPRIMNLMNILANTGHSNIEGMGGGQSKIHPYGNVGNTSRLNSTRRDQSYDDVIKNDRSMANIHNQLQSMKDYENEKRLKRFEGIERSRLKKLGLGHLPTISEGKGLYQDIKHLTGMGLIGDVRKLTGLGLGTGLLDDIRKYSSLGLGLGTGMGTGINAHHALKLANLATANANHQIAKMHNASVHGQLTQPPIKRHWDDPFAPHSRGTGIHDNLNMIRGRGSLVAQDHHEVPALTSQPYGANWHMQFFLPPQYHRYNDGSVLEGRGLYV